MLRLISIIFLILISCTPNDSSDVKLISNDNIELDVESPGPYEVTEIEYGQKIRNGEIFELDSRIDPLVMGDRITDLRGALYLPKSKLNHPNIPAPLLVFLHGEHFTCGRPAADGIGPRIDDFLQYTLEGKCSDVEGAIEAPSYLGYSYLAKHMASHGYVVISINANRGITGGTPSQDDLKDGMLIEARGRLVLKHIAWLRQWNLGSRSSVEDLGVDLLNKIDFSHVGFMGHSRGGEGVRAVLEQYEEQQVGTYAREIGPMKVEGIIEFAPVDLAGSRIYDGRGVNWAVVVGICDGDVESLEGTGPFRRRRESAIQENALSAIFAIPGANHNFFNSEWQVADSTRCPLGSPMLWDEAREPRGSVLQRRIGLLALSAFFRAYVGDIPSREKFQRIFDPQFRLPRQFTEITSPQRESFHHQKTEVVKQVLGNGRNIEITDFEEIFILSEKGDVTAANRRLTSIVWDTPSAEAYYDALLWTDGRNISDQWLLSFSIARHHNCGSLAKSCDADADLTSDFSISLLFSDGKKSKSVNLQDYLALTNKTNVFKIWQTCPSKFPDINSSTGNCESHSLDEASCSALGGNDFNPQRQRCIKNIVPTLNRSQLIFQEVPIELKDFGESDLQGVRGLRFTFDRKKGTHLLIDKSFSLRRQ